MSETLIIILTFYMSVIFTEANSNSCAYYAMGAVATPFDSCSIYSMSETAGMKYSSNYIFDKENNKLQWNYYSDLNCQNRYKSYEMDDIMMQIHHLNVQTTGAGSNCDTVHVRTSGSYSELMDSCDPDVTTDDYVSRAYVINECIPVATEGYSSILKCNNKEIYFDYYSQCTDCSCTFERYSFEYYEDKQKCYQVTCNSPSSSDILSHSVIYHKTDSQFIKTLITKEPNTPIFLPRKQQENKMVINRKIKPQNN
eukprot:793183_1